MKIEELAATLGKSALLFQGYKMTPEVVKAWFELFQNTEMQIFEQAMKMAVLAPGRTFFPAPGEVQEYIVKSSLSGQYSPEEAWQIANEIADGVMWHDLTKQHFQKKYELKNKPPFYLTLRVFWKPLCLRRDRKEYNPYGHPGPTIEQEKEELKYFKISFIQEYKSKLASYNNNLELGLPLEPDLFLPETTAKKYINGLNLTIKGIQ